MLLNYFTLISILSLGVVGRKEIQRPFEIVQGAQDMLEGDRFDFDINDVDWNWQLNGLTDEELGINPAEAESLNPAAQVVDGVHQVPASPIAAHVAGHENIHQEPHAQNIHQEPHALNIHQEPHMHALNIHQEPHAHVQQRLVFNPDPVPLNHPNMDDRPSTPINDEHVGMDIDEFFAPTPPPAERPHSPPALVRGPRAVPRLIPASQLPPGQGAAAVEEAVREVASVASRLRF